MNCLMHTLRVPQGVTYDAASRTVSGSAELNRFVHVYIDGTLVGIATPTGPTAAWSFVLPASVTAGAHELTATTAAPDESRPTTAQAITV